ncbi:MAG: YjbQ family protein [Desulfobulbaceae bacterium]|uniref:YjbQ family protein n=1 Tax=Candidatus Desulfobia pelagia TaxID=2841692 RepID=A0A8J6TH37_9BACT|nr:YjbQ family protein [Candidatus Desulfobia pelagia]
MVQGTLAVTTTRKMELVDITGLVSRDLLAANVTDGICYLFNPHTTAALTINEGADPAVRTDIVQALREIIPFDLNYQHLEGNSPSHVLASLFGCSEVVFVENGRMKLGTWQKIFFCEFDGPRSRKIHWRVV